MTLETSDVLHQRWLMGVEMQLAVTPAPERQHVFVRESSRKSDVT